MVVDTDGSGVYVGRGYVATLCVYVGRGYVATLCDYVDRGYVATLCDYVDRVYVATLCDYVDRGYVATLCVSGGLCGDPLCLCLFLLTVTRVSGRRSVHTFCDWLMDVPLTHVLPLAGEALNDLP